VIVALALSSDARTTAGILLLTILAVEYGVVMLRIVRGRQPATDFQKSFARAGHAHAGVFVVFALVAQILADAADLDGIADVLAP
jgi:drug/metabolite transporter superfamily protein YnfA